MDFSVGQRGSLECVSHAKCVFVGKSVIVAYKPLEMAVFAGKVGIDNYIGLCSIFERFQVK